MHLAECVAEALRSLVDEIWSTANICLSPHSQENFPRENRWSWFEVRAAMLRQVKHCSSNEPCRSLTRKRERERESLLSITVLRDTSSQHWLISLGVPNQFLLSVPMLDALVNLHGPNSRHPSGNLQFKTNRYSNATKLMQACTMLQDRPIEIRNPAEALHFCSSRSTKDSTKMYC